MKHLFLFSLCMSCIFGKKFEPVDFSGLKESMPKLDPELLDIHLKLYKGYVAQVNYINAQMQKENNSFVLQSLRKQYAFEYDGMVLHEIYFCSLGGDGKPRKEYRIIEKIKSEFGSFVAFKGKVHSFAKTRGIGWIILFSKIDGGDLKLCWVQSHQDGFLSGYVPVYVIDLWEHAYISQFGLDKQAYIDLMFEYTDWKIINYRYINNCKSIKSGFKKL